jgi:hypothetical protein
MPSMQKPAPQSWYCELMSAELGCSCALMSARRVARRVEAALDPVIAASTRAVGGTILIVMPAANAGASTRRIATRSGGGIVNTASTRRSVAEVAKMRTVGRQEELRRVNVK